VKSIERECETSFLDGFEGSGKRGGTTTLLLNVAFLFTERTRN